MPVEWIEIVKVFGAPTALFMGVLYALHRQMWVPGWVYREVKQQRDTLEAKLDRVLS